MPSINNTPSHRSPTPPEERQEHIRRAVAPLSRSLSIERSERFPHCLLEIPLAMLWPKQTLRPAPRTYSPHNYLRLSPKGSSLSIIPVCVLSLAQPQPALFTRPHSHRRLLSHGPSYTIIDRRNLSPENEDPAYPPLSNHNMSSWDAEINAHAAKVAAIRNQDGHLNGIVRKFTRPGFAYALAPL